MNTVKTLTAVSAAMLLALGSTAPVVHAQQNDAPPVGTGNMGEDAEKAWKKTKEDISEAYKDVKSVFTDENGNTKLQPVMINPSRTAVGIIDQPVYNRGGERVATVKDIILDANGKASMIVLADGEFPGVDMKLTAFNYSLLTQQNTDGDIIMPLTEDMIDQAAAFSYDKKDESDKVRVTPNNGYSVAELLKADLINEKKEEIAQIDNISLKSGQADQLIVDFNRVLGLGGEKAAIGYKEAKIVRDDKGNLDFQLNANQTAQFENFKKNTAKTN